MHFDRSLLFPTTRTRGRVKKNGQLPHFLHSDSLLSFFLKNLGKKDGKVMPQRLLLAVIFPRLHLVCWESETTPALSIIKNKPATSLPPEATDFTHRLSSFSRKGDEKIARQVFWLVPLVVQPSQPLQERASGTSPGTTSHSGTHSSGSVRDLHPIPFSLRGGHETYLTVTKLSAPQSYKKISNSPTIFLLQSWNKLHTLNGHNTAISLYPNMQLSNINI